VLGDLFEQDEEASKYWVDGVIIADVALQPGRTVVASGQAWCADHREQWQIPTEIVCRFSEGPEPKLRSLEIRIGNAAVGTLADHRNRSITKIGDPQNWLLEFELDAEGCLRITRKQVMPLLMKAAPGFEESWREHLKWWDGEERGDFNDIAEFAHYLVRSYAAGELSELPAVFATVERILQGGTDSAKELVATGLLEDIQTIASHESFGADAFVKWLGPLSSEAWSEIDRLWRAGGGSLPGVVRLARAIEPQRKVTVRRKTGDGPTF
jgi:hypothetical protein